MKGNIHWLPTSCFTQSVAYEQVAVECKMTMEVDAYVESFRPELMDAVSAWVRGAKFGELVRGSDFFEGSLVRAIRRLEELMRQVGSSTSCVCFACISEG